jgi:hypothetical protein
MRSEPDIDRGDARSLAHEARRGPALRDRAPVPGRRPRPQACASAIIALPEVRRCERGRRRERERMLERSDRLVVLPVRLQRRPSSAYGARQQRVFAPERGLPDVDRLSCEALGSDVIALGEEHAADLVVRVTELRMTRLDGRLADLERRAVLRQRAVLVPTCGEAAHQSSKPPSPSRGGPGRACARASLWRPATRHCSSRGARGIARRARHCCAATSTRRTRSSAASSTIARLSRTWCSARCSRRSRARGIPQRRVLSHRARSSTRCADARRSAASHPARPADRDRADMLGEPERDRGGDRGRHPGRHGT